MSNTTMTAEAKNAYNAYMREWRQKNPTKNAEYKARHWEKKAREMEEREAAQIEKDRK